ncbi:MAG: hypothetical protein AAGA80_08625, partial [Cyanobacteria bacterium P01_F01_bin.143]
FQDSTKQETLGDPRVITNQGVSAQFSRFNLAIVIGRDQINFRRTIGFSSAIYLFILAIAIIGALRFKKHFSKVRLSEKSIWLSSLVSSFILLFATEIILIQVLKQLTRGKYLEFIILLFDILWWVAGAYFLGQALKLFLWQPLAKRRDDQFLPY